jgi:hypothetical protein
MGVKEQDVDAALLKAWNMILRLSKDMITV